MAYALIGGTLANKSVFDAAGVLAERKSNSNANCTFTLISSSWVEIAQLCRWAGYEEDPLKFEHKQ